MSARSGRFVSSNPNITKQVTCQWFLLCVNGATATREHPVLGSVPICQRCNDKVERLSQRD